MGSLDFGKMFQLLTHNFLDVVLLSSWKKFFIKWQKSEHKGSIINYLQHLLQESGQQAARRASLVEEQQELQEGKAEVERMRREQLQRAESLKKKTERAELREKEIEEEAAAKRKAEVEEIERARKQLEEEKRTAKEQARKELEEERKAAEEVRRSGRLDVVGMGFL